MSTLRLRFTFNRRTGQRFVGQGGTRGVENFSRVIVQQVAFKFAEGEYEQLKERLQTRLRTDIQRELDHTAKMFMSSIIGVPGRNLGPKGSLTTVAPRSDFMSEEGLPLQTSVRGLIGNWERRSPKYWNHQGPWFQAHFPSRIDSLRSASTWTGAFGDIAVTVTKHTDLESFDPAARSIPLSKGLRGGVGKIGVATIRVEAMQHITPQMLPALGGGALNDYGASPRSSGLLKLLGDPIAWRLGGNPARVPFRPTIQPFLAFFLTRQLPNAVFRRIEQGFQSSTWHHGDGGAGRTR